MAGQSSRQSILLRLPLTLKTLLTIIIVGAIAWLGADYLGRLTIKNAFQNHLNDDLKAKAAEDRFNFSRYVYEYREVAKIFASQNNMLDFAEQADWKPDDIIQITFHNRPPAWFAKTSLLRTLLTPRITMLLDKWGNIREVYQSKPGELPKEIFPPSRRLLLLCNNENYLMPLTDGPYLVTSQTLKNTQQNVVGTLVLASPIDQDFLLASQGIPSKGFQVALVTEEKLNEALATGDDPFKDVPLRILVSSDMQKLPKGTLVNDLPEHLLIMQQEFFEYGASEMSFRFVTLVSTDLVGPQTKKIVNNDRLRHGIQILVFMIILALILIAYTRRIERLTGRVIEFSHDSLGRKPLMAQTGDQIQILENEFQALTAAVNSRTTDLEAANNELKEFAYVVSHDLKAPLRAIGQLTTWISQDYADLFDKEGREQLDLLVARAKRMNSLIDGILQYSKVGRIQEDNVRVDLDSLVKDIIGDLAPPNNIVIKVKNNLPTITCEKIRIRQVFQNLLSNAIKFIDKPKGEISISADELSSHWQVSVTDNGCGLEEKYFEKIFQIFQTLSPRDEIESTGIGLSIVKKIVEQHGGEIWLESELGKGTTFYFTISK